MDTNEPKDEGYLIIPRSWLKDMAEKQNKILIILEDIAGYDAKNCLGDYITELEAKKQLRKSTTWFWYMKKNGYLTFSKIGNKNYYRKEDIKNLLGKDLKYNKQRKI